jgi:two-component system, chemotaxis family, protein-glutamate methylesterase/glutaminase
MRTIRVLVIDDSVVVRRFVSDVLSAEPDLAVAGVAPTGRIGLSKITQSIPDLVILDLEMPEMDGLETLAEIRRKWPLLPVIMYSSRTRRGAIATLDALEAGANDYVTKPSQMGSPEDAVRCVRTELIPKIRALVPGAKPPVIGAHRDGLGGTAPLSPRTPRELGQPHHPVAIVAIGTSTGGPNALAAIIPTLPADFPVPIVIVQHMPPLFTAMLADRLASKAAISVSEATHGGLLRPGHAWIAPGDRHMTVTCSGGMPRVELNQGPHENSCRPSVDVLFRATASAYGAGTLGVVLTGMGNDGLKGCELIREAGGSVFVQDEASSVVWGMPGFVARADLAERVLPLDLIGPTLVGRCREPLTIGRAV